MLSEISQTEKDKYCMVSFICGIHKSQTHKTESRVVVTRGWGWGKWGDDGRRVQAASFRMDKFWGSNVQHEYYN